MRVLTLANLAGGACRTTSALTLGATWAVNGDRVLLVDLDPQGDLTVSCGLARADQASALLRGDTLPEPHVVPLPAGSLTGEGTLDVIRSDGSLQHFVDSPPVQLADRLVDLLNAVEGRYDWVIFDSPRQERGILPAALGASDEVYVPVAAGRAAHDGLVEVIAVLRSHGLPAPRGAFCARANVASNHDRDFVAYLLKEWGLATGSDGLALVGPDGAPLFVRETVRVREAEMARVPLPFYAPEATAANDYAAVASAIASLPPAATPAASRLDWSPKPLHVSLPRFVSDKLHSMAAHQGRTKASVVAEALLAHIELADPTGKEYPWLPRRGSTLRPSYPARPLGRPPV